MRDDGDEPPCALREIDVPARLVGFLGRALLR